MKSVILRHDIQNAIFLINERWRFSTDCRRTTAPRFFICNYVMHSSLRLALFARFQLIISCSSLQLCARRYSMTPGYSPAAISERAFATSLGSSGLQ